MENTGLLLMEGPGSSLTCYAALYRHQVMKLTAGMLLLHVAS